MLNSIRPRSVNPHLFAGFADDPVRTFAAPATPSLFGGDDDECDGEFDFSNLQEKEETGVKSKPRRKAA